ncbi:hypothetical protein Pelo_12092 [Pelomyxa schiedti]|nr:hypothetical protein Pelo_12092 [Pelomyxa schiedti]
MPASDVYSFVAGKEYPIGELPEIANAIPSQENSICDFGKLSYRILLTGNKSHCHDLSNNSIQQPSMTEVYDVIRGIINIHLRTFPIKCPRGVNHFTQIDIKRTLDNSTYERFLACLMSICVNWHTNCAHHCKSGITLLTALPSVMLPRSEPRYQCSGTTNEKSPGTDALKKFILYMTPLCESTDTTKAVLSFLVSVMQAYEGRWRLLQLSVSSNHWNQAIGNGSSTEVTNRLPVNQNSASSVHINPTTKTT